MKRNLAIVVFAVVGLAWLALAGSLLATGGDKSGLVVCGRSAGGAPEFNCEENNPAYR